MPAMIASRPDMEYLPLAVLAGDLLRRAQGARLPLAGTVELTHRCNQRCLHCYCNLPADHPRAGEEGDTDFWRTTIDALAGAGCLWLLVTGGEVLLRPDFPAIWRHAKQRGLLLSLFTNATLVTPAIADLLAEWRPYRIEVTLYGAGEDTWHRVTGCRHGFDRCLRGIELMRQHSLPLSLKSMILRQNQGDLAAMRQLAERLGLPFRFDAQPHRRPEGDDRTASFRLDARTVAALDHGDPERWQAWREFAGRAAPANPPAAPLPLGCDAGTTSFHIDPYGRLTACGMLTSPGHDLRGRPFAAAWESLGRGLVPVPAATDDFPCPACRLYELCNQCPGWAQAEHGRTDRPVAFLCDLTRERAKLLRMDP
ncbi:MAG: radical SAM protein [Thermodesulfobacteriota bacterium]